MPNELTQYQTDALIEALTQYATPESWGETSSSSDHKIQNRFLVKGFGGAIAIEALAICGIEVKYPDSEPNDEILQEINHLINIQRSSDHHPGWVFHRLKENDYATKMTFDHWNYLADQLGYTSSWAYHKHDQFRDFS